MITDKEISEQLYEAYYMKVYSFVMTLAKSKTLAEEITQEVFFRAITTEKTFRGERRKKRRDCKTAKGIQTKIRTGRQCACRDFHDPDPRLPDR